MSFGFNIRLTVANFRVFLAFPYKLIARSQSKLLKKVVCRYHFLISVKKERGKQIQQEVRISDVISVFAGTSQALLQLGLDFGLPSVLQISDAVKCLI